MKTIITHFYNEEYLLPWWLEHHKKYFDFGILIDHHSTDRSVEICKQICPNWQVVTSMHSHFDAADCDYEIMFYERQLPSWRIALTTTEFLLGDLNTLMHNEEGRHQWIIPGFRFTAWNLNGTLDESKLLWDQINTGISYFENPMAHQCRSLHNFNDIHYETGRHFLPHNTTDAYIFHYAHCIIGEPMLNRRLQIQHRVSSNDKINGLGSHHYFDYNGMDTKKLEVMHKEWIAIGEKQLDDIILTMKNKIAK